MLAATCGPGECNTSVADAAVLCGLAGTALVLIATCVPATRSLIRRRRAMWWTLARGRCDHPCIVGPVPGGRLGGIRELASVVLCCYSCPAPTRTAPTAGKAAKEHWSRRRVRLEGMAVENCRPAGHGRLGASRGQRGVVRGRAEPSVREGRRQLPCRLRHRPCRSGHSRDLDRNRDRHRCHDRRLCVVAEERPRRVRPADPRLAAIVGVLLLGASIANAAIGR